MGRAIAAVLAVLAALTLPVVPAPPASAAGCSQAEVIFARGRLEPAGPGRIGAAMVEALRTALPDTDIGLYPVRYAADTDVVPGANDMSRRVQYMLANCPNTRLVLGGYSLGAAVTDLVLAAPTSFFGWNDPLPPAASSHIAAVALFGNGSNWLGPITTFSPAYRDRTIELCHGADPICNPADPKTWRNNWPDHLAGAYLDAGMAQQAANFVAGKLRSAAPSSR
ncbi:cutinase family protein [Mycolicibacillus trivialis]